MIKATPDLLYSAGSLEEAVRQLFQVKTNGSRKLVLTEKDFTPEIGAAYDFIGRNHRSATYHRIAQDIISRVPHKEKVTTWREIGCGSGLLTLALAHQLFPLNATKRIVKEISSIDVSPAMIAMARHNLSDWYQQPQRYNDHDPYYGFTITFQQADIYDCKYESGKWDFIVCRNVLHRLADPAEALQIMYKHLADHGKIYIRDINREADWVCLVRRIGEQNSNPYYQLTGRWLFPELVKDYVGALANAFAPAELTQLLQSCGIKKFTLSEGSYLGEKIYDETVTNGIEEFSQETEFVCVIEK